MSPDSPAPALPLAQAIETWSDPDLLEAVRVAEAPFAPDALDRLESEWVESLRRYCLQTPQAAGRPRASDTRVAHLHRVWEALLIAFGGRVERREILLWGRLISPLQRRDPEPIQPARAQKMLVYPRRAGILVREEIYGDVTAIRQDARNPVDVPHVPRTSEPLPLIDAFREWTGPTALADVCRCEQQLTEYEIAQLPGHILLSDKADLTQPTSTRWMAGPTDYSLLMAANHTLLADFRARLTRGDFHLRGVRSRPVRERHAITIPGVWAADLTFDLLQATATMGEQRFVAVSAVWGLAPPNNDTHEVAAAEDVVPEPDTSRPPPITADSVKDLTDEEILILLEEHARWVVENGSNLHQPGKISLIPIVRRKMEHRAATGELASKLSEETAFLAGWISERLPSHSTPSAATIANALRHEYARLKPRSKATI